MEYKTPNLTVAPMTTYQTDGLLMCNGGNLR